VQGKHLKIATGGEAMRGCGENSDHSNYCEKCSTCWTCQEEAEERAALNVRNAALEEVSSMLQAQHDEMKSREFGESRKQVPVDPVAFLYKQTEGATMTPKPTTIERAAKVARETQDGPWEEAAAWAKAKELGGIAAIVTSWEAEPPPVMVDRLAKDLTIMVNGMRGVG
jgi:hypothetical protein